MKRRFLYTLLFGLPGSILSLIVSALFFGAMAGGLWLFVFGDNSWPPALEAALPIVFVAIFLGVWLAFLIAGFMVGRQRERDATLNKAHVWVSIGLTLLMILFIGAWQVSNGNLGPRSVETQCSEFCMQKGYSASSVSPRNSAERTCSCLNANGAEIIQVPLSTLEAGK